ncbi:MAG: hypothetical protein JO061_15825 [Acidobacteriaceae bacterium]|nr:hypothetical protein [Acidobacteriaceae bacterium]
MKIEIDVPKVLYDEAKSLAQAQRMSVREVFASALSDHLLSWRRLNNRAARGSRDAFLRVLDSVPDIEPEEYDRLDTPRKPPE